MSSRTVVGPGIVPGRRRAKLVYVVSSDELLRGRVTAMLRGTADQVRQCVALADIDVAVIESAAVIVLVAASAPTAVLDAAIRAYRAADPATAVLLCLRAGTRTVHQLATLARGGVDELVWMDEPGTAEIIRGHVQRRLTHALPIEFVRTITPQVEDKVRSYCGWCFRNAFRPLVVTDIEDWFRKDSRTLRRDLTDASLPSLHEIINLARLVHVAKHIDSSSASFEAISKSLEFPSASALSMFVRRAIQRSPTELKSHGAVDCMKLEIPRRLHR